MLGFEKASKEAETNGKAKLKAATVAAENNEKQYAVKESAIKVSQYPST